MTELFFPVFGAMVVFLVAVPLLTLLSRGVLGAVPIHRNSINRYGNPWRYALTIGPTLAPVIWLVSATVHQSEEGAPLAACVVDHLGAEVCRDVVLFGFVIFSVLGVGVVRRMRGARISPRRGGPPSNPASANRLRSVCTGHLALSPFASRIHVVEQGRAPVCTRGLLRPVVEVEAQILATLSDEELEAVLLHELEHAHARDPLRLFIAQVSLTINPLGRLLEAEFGRYCFSREAQCDRRAVQLGADPLSLARSIVSVAGVRPAPAFTAALGGHGVSGIRVRVHLLLEYASRWPGPAAPRAPIGLLTLAGALLAILPHVMGTGPLDALHQSVESAALLLGLG